MVDDLAAATEGGLLGSPGGRFFAWVIGGTMLSAIAADWLTSTWDQNAGLYATAPAAAVAEEVVGEWLLDLLDLPRDASFALVTGCQMAHVTALAAARSGVLRDAGWNVERDGLFGAPRIRVLANATRHVTIDRALRLLGFGENAVQPVETDERGRVTADALRTRAARRLGADDRRPRGGGSQHGRIRPLPRADPDREVGRGLGARGWRVRPDRARECDEAPPARRGGARGQLVDGCAQVAERAVRQWDRDRPRSELRTVRR